MQFVALLNAAIDLVQIVCWSLTWMASWVVVCRELCHCVAACSGMECHEIDKALWVKKKKEGAIYCDNCVITWSFSTQTQHDEMHPCRMMYFHNVCVSLFQWFTPSEAPADAAWPYMHILLPTLCCTLIVEAKCDRWPWPFLGHRAWTAAKEALACCMMQHCFTVQPSCSCQLGCSVIPMEMRCLDLCIKVLCAQKHGKRYAGDDTAVAAKTSEKERGTVKGLVAGHGGSVPSALCVQSPDKAWQRLHGEVASGGWQLHAPVSAFP